MIGAWRICKRLIIILGVLTLIPMLLVFIFATLRWIFVGKPAIDVLDYITEDWVQR